MIIDNNQISEDSIFRVGKVIAVKGRLIEIKVDKTKNSSNLLYKGELLKNISVGGYIKIIKGFTKIIGKVDGEYVEEDKKISGKKYSNGKSKIDRILNVSLLGFFKGNVFERGIKELPLIDNECFLLQSDEFGQVHNFLKKNDISLTIGNLSLEKGQSVKIGINGLFASHIGIFGNTGSGKSYTLAKLYRELFGKYKNNSKFKKKAEFYLIDFNGEYVDVKDNVIVEKRYKNIYKLSTRVIDADKYPLTKDDLNEVDFWTVFLEATEKTQTPFLRRALNNVYLDSRLINENEFKLFFKRMVYAATNEGNRDIEKAVIVNLVSDISDCFGSNLTVLINDYKENLQYHSGVHKYFYQSNRQIFSNDSAFEQEVIDNKIDPISFDFSSLSDIEKIKLKIIVQYYDDIIHGYINKEHLAPLIKRLDKRIEDIKKVICIKSIAEIKAEKNRNITVISLRDVNVHMRKVLPLLFCRKLYNDKKTENDDTNYLNIIIDEAHNILSESSNRESEQWKDYRLETFEEIIKEGRKFGVFLTVASQRPSDISPTIISQLHNYFLHRLINNEDIKAVEKTISFLDKVSFEYLPILPTGTCIFAGLVANIPIVVDVGKIESKYEPKNKTITLTDKWEVKKRVKKNELH